MAAHGPRHLEWLCTLAGALTHRQDALRASLLGAGYAVRSTQVHLSVPLNRTQALLLLPDVAMNPSRLPERWTDTAELSVQELTFGDG